MLRKKVLVVDDSATAVMWQRMLLEREAYDVITASDGDEAVERALSELPDLILLDVVMPRMDGLAACRAIRADERGRSMPILIVSTRGESATVLGAYECGCNEYILKPIDRAEFMMKVRGYLERTSVGDVS